MSIPAILKAVAKPVQVVHRTVGDFTYNGTTGWNASASNSLVFAFTQAQPYYSIGGGPYAAFANPYDNWTGFQGVYDMYRVKKIWLDIYPSVAPPGPNQAATYAPIMVYALSDYTDGGQIGSQTAALAYDTCKVMQMCQGQKESGETKFRLTLDRPACNVGVDSINVGVTTNSMNARAPWLYTSNTTAEFGFAKFYGDSVQPINATVLHFTVVVNCLYEYKLCR